MTNEQQLREEVWNWLDDMAETSWTEGGYRLVEAKNVNETTDKLVQLILTREQEAYKRGYTAGVLDQMEGNGNA